MLRFYQRKLDRSRCIKLQVLLRHYRILENTLHADCFKKISTSMDVKIKKTCQMAAVISLQRYGDSFSSYYGELTRMHQDKVTSLEAQSQVYNMVELARKELWSGTRKATNNYLPSRKAGESYYFIAFPSNSLNIVYNRCDISAVITVPAYNMARSVNCCYYATFTLQ